MDKKLSTEDLLLNLIDIGKWIKDAIKKNFPVSITQWIDLFSLQTVAVLTNNFLLFRYEVPAGKYGVIKYFTFSLRSGNLANVNTRIMVNGVIQPISENITNVSIITDPEALQPIHIELRPYDVIEVRCDNQDGFQQAEVFGRVVGWTYEK